MVADEEYLIKELQEEIVKLKARIKELEAMVKSLREIRANIVL